MTKLEKVSVKSRINHKKNEQIFHEQLLKQDKCKTSGLDFMTSHNFPVEYSERQTDEQLWHQDL